MDKVFTISEDFEVPVVNDARSIPAYVALSDGIAIGRACVYRS